MLNEATFETFGPVRKVESGENGRKWLRLTIPIDRGYMDGDTKVERTTWFEAVCFRPKLIKVIEALIAAILSAKKRLRETGAVFVWVPDSIYQHVPVSARSAFEPCRVKADRPLF